MGDEYPHPPGFAPLTIITSLIANFIYGRGVTRRVVLRSGFDNIEH